MKILSIFVCAAIVALFLPACATAPKQAESCCSAKGACETPATKHKR